MKTITVSLVILAILLAASLKTCTSGGVMGEYTPFSESLEDILQKGVFLLILLFLIRLAIVKTSR